MSRVIATTVCLKTGHKIVSFVVQELVDPKTSLVIKKYELRCEKCSLALEDIRKFRRLPKGQQPQEET